MADEPVTPGGWLPPSAPGGKPPPRFDAPSEPRWTPPARPDQAADQAADQGAQPVQQPPDRSQQRGGPTFVRPDPGERNAAAVWALALGISGLALLVLSLGTLFMVTLPCSIAAWVLGLRARGRLERGETAQGGGQATAALWLGRIGVLAGVAAMVAIVALLASGFDFEQFRDDLQRELDRQRREESDGVRTAVERLRAAVGAGPAR